MQKSFQTRLYRLDTQLTRVAGLKDLQAPPAAPATRIGDSLKQFAAETADLPVGAVVLLSDGSDNSGGIDPDTISALRNRRIPVHTVGFGLEQIPNDVEINDAVVAPRALADSRLSARVSFHQRGYCRAQSHADRARRRQGSGLARRHLWCGRQDPNRKPALQRGLRGRENAAISHSTPAGEAKSDQQRRDAPGERRSRTSAASCTSKASRAGNTNSSAAPKMTTASCRSPPCCAPPKTKSIARASAIPKNWPKDFPRAPKISSRYQGLIIGSVEAGYFTLPQQDLIREFVDRRGGGLLFLGGRFGLADGGWAGSNLADSFRRSCPPARIRFHRDPATVELTPAGADSIITRLIDDPVKNIERWKKLPYLMDYQDAGTPKPGAAVLAEMDVHGRKLPFLITENYGRGRTAVVASGGVWRWQMSQPLGDTDARHVLAADCCAGWSPIRRDKLSPPCRIKCCSTMAACIFPPTFATNRSSPRPTRTWKRISSARMARPASIEMSPVPDAPGQFQADWTAEKPGSYVTEVVAQRGDQEIGRDVLTFQRMDGVAENFHTEQNRDLLEKLASQTGGRYWRPEELSKLPAEIPYSEAGITMRETKELWNMPIIFLVLILLRFAEWLLRRKWGVV